MSRDGGYTIIDLNDFNITSSGVIIKGVYNRIAKNYRKVLLISGITINGNQFSDTFGKCKEVGGNFVIHAFSTIADNVLDEYDLVVEENDKVSLNVKTVIGGTDLPQNIFIVREEEENG